MQILSDVMKAFPKKSFYDEVQLALEKLNLSRRYHYEYFMYTSLLEIPADSHGYASMHVYSDSNFNIIGGYHTTYKSHDFNQLFFAPNLMIRLTDQATGRALFSDFIPIDNILGNKNFETVWHVPKILLASSVLESAIKNEENFGVSTQLTFCGLKQFTRDGSKKE